MSYQDKYKATFATKGGKIAYLYLQEDVSTTPTLIKYQGIELNLQYIPTSDDPFESIYVSQLNCILDVTDETTGLTSPNIPDLTTLNDRKYFAKLFLDTNLEWCGWVLCDSIRLNYTTGRKELAFNAIDGLGMLKSILLQIDATVNINNINNLIYYINNCLNSIGFPINLNLKTICSYYAASMDTRATHSYSEPFIQSYLPYRTFIENGVYISSLDVITNIVKSFGCRLFQAGGKWWIVSVNEFANINAYYTEYDYTGTVVSSGTINTLSTIQGYTGNTSGVYFIDNTQTKLLKKGYNRIESNVNVETSENYFSNSTFRPYVGNQASNWNAYANGGLGNSAVIIDNTTEAFAQYRLNIGTTTGSNAYFEIKSTSYPKITSGVLLEFSWIFQGQDMSSYPRGFVYIQIYDGTYSYWWNGTAWVTTSQFCVVPAYTGASGSDINSYTIKTAITPLSGSLHFKYSLEGGTGNFVQISNVSLKITPLIKTIDYYNYITSNIEYVKNITIPYGGYTSYGVYPIEKGIIQLSNGYNATDWFEYGSSTTYPSLLSLIMQKYINIFGNNIINVDCSLSSFDTANGILNASKLLKSTDNDPVQVNISNNSYMLGNATINYTKDETQASLLQISNIDITNTSNYLITYNTLI